MAKLVIFQESGAEEPVFEDYDLVSQRLLIGSEHDNDLVLEALGVDSTHASLELRDESWILQDLGGPGGTFVNGNEIEGPFRLQHGDLIELGSVKLRFQEIENEAKKTGLSEEGTSSATEVEIRGRVWFATVAGITLAVIFIIVFLLIIADFLGLLRIADLFPF